MHFGEQEITYEKLKHSMIALKINYEQMEVKYVKEQISMTMMSLISNIGNYKRII